jgi:hypothetical protein
MSLAKSIAGFILSSLFIMFLYLSITSYTIGGLLQKESIKDFVLSQTQEEAVQQNCEDMCSSNVNYEKCTKYCAYLDEDSRKQCEETCLSEAKQNCINNICLPQFSKSQEYIFNMIDGVYNKEVFSGVTINDVVPVFNNFLLLLILSLIFGFLIFFVSENPISKLGNDLIIIAISLLSIAVIPVFIITPDISILKLISDYIMEGFKLQIILGIIVLVIGIALAIIGRKLKSKKEISKEKPKQKKTSKKK